MIGNTYRYKPTGKLVTVFAKAGQNYRAKDTEGQEVLAYREDLISVDATPAIRTPPRRTPQALWPVALFNQLNRAKHWDLSLSLYGDKIVRVLERSTLELVFRTEQGREVTIDGFWLALKWREANRENWEALMEHLEKEYLAKYALGEPDV